MTSIIKLTAFSGVQGETPPCYMLQVDNFKFLLDCGWDEKFDMNYMENLKKHLPQIDAVLLSYPDPSHLGALPYLVGKCNLTCPIYATIPVYKMGQMFMYDLYQSRHNTEDFDLFTLDDVDAAFDKINQLKYSQTVWMKGKGHGITVTPVAAGHMLGGTIWKIVKDGQEEIVYAIDFNHKRERHLNGCVLESIQRPTVFITDAYNADYDQVRRRKRDEQLMSLIVETVRGDGNVLIALDTAGRVLEVAQMLDQMWKTQGSGLMAYSLAMLNNVSYNVVEFAKSQVEWMSDKVMRDFEAIRSNPFQFKHVQLCHSLAELSRIPEPKVVLASEPDMECGFSRDLFLHWCGNPRNTIVLTNRTSPGTLARKLIDLSPNFAENPNSRQINVEIRRRVRLEGAELDSHKKKSKEKRVEEKKTKADAAKREREELESSDESDTEMEVEGALPKPKHDLMLKQTESKKTGFFKQAKKSFPMFPLCETITKWDDYGEMIRAEDYAVSEPPAEEGVTPAKEAPPTKEEEEEPQEVSEIPTKCVRMIQSIDVRANVQFIDFEGRSDGDSVKKILAQIQPRQLIIVRGTEQATHKLADYARNKRDMVHGKVHTPQLNQVLDLTKESQIFQVRLKDSLVSSLEFHKAGNVRDTELAWIDARVDLTSSKIDTGAQGQDDPMGEDKAEDAVEVVPTLVAPHTTKGLSHASVLINEPRLSDFKQVLLKEGISAEFNGGVLVCNNTVAIRREGVGSEVQLEGCLCEDYYKIRKLLYSQYACL